MRVVEEMQTWAWGKYKFRFWRGSGSLRVREVRVPCSLLSVSCILEDREGEGNHRQEQSSSFLASQGGNVVLCRRRSRV